MTKRYKESTNKMSTENMILKTINIIILCFYFIFWVTLTRNEKKISWVSRYISNIHCYITFILIVCNFVFKNFSYSLFVSNSLFYWTMDIIGNSFYDSKLSRDIIIHHLFASLAIVVGYLTRPQLLPFALLSETSTIFLNKCWFIHQKLINNIYDNEIERVYLENDLEINGKILLLTYFISRVCNFSFIIWYFFDKNYLDSFLFLPLWGLNTWWFYLLIKRAKQNNIC